MPGTQRCTLPFLAGDILQFGSPEEAEKQKVKMYHRSQRESLENAFRTAAAAGVGGAASPPLEPTLV